MLRAESFRSRLTARSVPYSDSQHAGGPLRFCHADQGLPCAVRRRSAVQSRRSRQRGGGPVMGRPDPERIRTSIVERSRLSLRMGIRRFTRFTNAFSKKWENHWAAVSLWYRFYNFCRVHKSLRITPAMAVLRLECRKMVILGGRPPVSHDAKEIHLEHVTSVRRDWWHHARYRQIGRS